MASTPDFLSGNKRLPNGSQVRFSYGVLYLIINYFTMALTIADKYYLQAVDVYPFDLKEVIEYLSYALSYDDAHAPANCLMGQLYMVQLKDFEKAEYYLNQAIIANLSYPDSYKYLALLKVWINDIDAAFKIISYASKINGMNRTQLLWVKVLAFECRLQFKEAKAVIKEAKMICIQKELLDEFDLMLKRVNEKIKASKSAKRKALSSK